MSKLVNKIKSFYGHTISETKKCTWPNRQELVESTIIVIVSLTLLTITVAVFDSAFSSAVNFIVK